MVSTSMFTGLSGLRANQRFIDVTGNNLANANTPGFWTSRASFSDMLSMTLRSASAPTTTGGGVNPLQVGLGTKVSSISANTNQGLMLDTGRPMDLALEGKGFFTLTDGNRNYYTRVGTFALDSARKLVDQRNGFRVLNSTGGEIDVPLTATLPAVATSTVSFQGNLPARVTGPLAEILSSSGALQAGTAATKAGTLTFPANLTTMDGQRFSIQANGVTPQQVTIAATSFGGDLTSVSFADFKTGIESQANGVSVVQTTGGFEIRTETVGSASTLKLDNLNGTPLTGLGLTTNLATGSQSVATAATALDSLVGNTKDYVNGDKIQVTGKNPDGTPVAGTFVFGTNGTTLGDLTSFVSGLYTGATAALGADGKLSVTANAKGPANLSLSIIDDPSAAGRTVFPGFTVTQDGTGPDTVTTSIDVFDTLGRPHPVTMVLTRTADNVWDLKASLPAADGTIVDDTMTGVRFNADGSFAGVTGTGGGDDRLIFNFTGLSTPQTVALDLGAEGTFDGLSMLGDKTSAAATSQDGAPAGELLDVSFSQSGVLEGFYSNGKTSPIATLRIALFSNPAGLSRIGDSLLVESANSSSAILTTAGGGGSGKVIAGALEGSNVDVAEEFVKLIEAQRGFQASARVITTSDEILAEIMNLVR